MQDIHTSSGTLSYVERGVGEIPVVFIHGAGGTHQHWGYQIRDLAPRTRVVVPDLPGHGQSALPGHDRVDGYAATITALLNALQIDRAILAGHSMGAAVALWTAIEHPERVAGLGLVGAGARMRVAPAVLEGLLTDRTATIKLIVSLCYHADTPPDVLRQAEENYRHCDAQTFHGDFVACDRFDVRERLATVNCPTVIVVGDQDRMTPPRHAEALRDQIAGATLITVSGGDHMPMIRRPDEVTAAISDLLGRCGV
jgi:pimeloyl-ACP methyl ester carboxylesterase